MGSQSKKHAVLLCVKTSWLLKRLFGNNETLKNLDYVAYEVVPLLVCISSCLLSLW